MLGELKIEKRSSMRSQISGYLRDTIRRGKIPVGAKLPTTQEMAKRWDTPVANVHAALTPLVKEGLLIRKQGVGTIVNTLERKLKTIAVYARQDLRHPASNFGRLLLNEIEQILTAQNIEMRIVFENRAGSGLTQIMDLADTRQIQGVIVPAIPDRKVAELKKISVPFACLTSCKVKNRVWHTSDSMIRELIKAVHCQGGKKLAIITTKSDSVAPKYSGEFENQKYYVKLFAALKTAGIETRPEWNCILNDDSLVKYSKYPHYAFESFNKIWATEEKPDTLFVYPDDLIMGTLLAITTHNIKVPDELGLIMHRNSGSDVLCPLPCFFIKHNVRKTANGLIKLIKDQFDGKEVNQIELEYTSEEHNSELK
jgi:DNA-binding LacI/PurR family transcriptional regulator